MEAELHRVLSLLQEKVGHLTTELAVATACAQQWAERALTAEAALEEAQKPSVGDEPVPA